MSVLPRNTVVCVSHTPCVLKHLAIFVLQYQSLDNVGKCTQLHVGLPCGDAAASVTKRASSVSPLLGEAECSIAVVISREWSLDIPGLHDGPQRAQRAPRARHGPRTALYGVTEAGEFAHFSSMVHLSLSIYIKYTARSWVYQSGRGSRVPTCFVLLLSTLFAA